ncbi:MAG: signal recognition particle-docking protein FtsY [Alphaproteobacteria bacterium]
MNETSGTRKLGWFTRLKAGLSRSSSKLVEGITQIVAKRRLDQGMLDELEDLLISADLGPATAARVTAAIARNRFDREVSANEIREALADEIAALLAPVERPLVIDAARKPHVILVVGVNGSGKTTTIGKLAAQFRNDGKRIMMAAGDTFRAAAVSQLQIWGERTGAAVITAPDGADAAGLAFDALTRARSEGQDVLLIDTAGRLQNKQALMDELAKIVRVLRKIDPDAPHSCLLVLDATTGQNARSQVKTFREIAAVTGLVVTKLDGTARGGVLVALAEEAGVPVHAIGVGEQIDDLRPFAARPFARSLLGLDERL